MAAYTRESFSFGGFWSQKIANNPEVSMENPHGKWDVVSMLPTLTEEYILANKENLVWKYVSMNPVVGEMFMLNNQDLPWDAHWICHNPNMTLNWFHNIIGWLQTCVSYNNFTDAVMTALSRNPGLTYDFLVFYPHLNWQTHMIRQTPSAVTDQEVTYWEVNLNPRRHYMSHTHPAYDPLTSSSVQGHLTEVDNTTNEEQPIEEDQESDEESARPVRAYASFLHPVTIREIPKTGNSRFASWAHK